VEGRASGGDYSNQPCHLISEQAGIEGATERFITES
jgi:hypothetical protein